MNKYYFDVVIKVTVPIEADTPQEAMNKFA